MTGSVGVSRHERDHVLAGAAAVHRVCPAHYDQWEITVAVKRSEGSCLLSYGDPVGNHDDLALCQKVAGLAAIGPAAILADPVGMIRAGDLDGMAKGASLSSADVELIEHLGPLDGPAGTQLALIALATKAMRDALGTGGSERLAKLLRDASNQGVLHWDLFQLIPQHIAAGAVKRAEAALGSAMGATSPGGAVVDGLVARTKAEQAARR